jgi:hypothetical protein
MVEPSLIAISHDLKFGYMPTFDKLSTKEYYVAILNSTYCEVVTKCPAHAEKFVRLIEDM